jgi:hypothetical protein
MAPPSSSPPPSSTSTHSSTWPTHLNQSAVHSQGAAPPTIQHHPPGWRLRARRGDCPPRSVNTGFSWQEQAETVGLAIGSGQLPGPVSARKRFDEHASDRTRASSTRSTRHSSDRPRTRRRRLHRGVVLVGGSRSSPGSTSGKSLETRPSPLFPGAWPCIRSVRKRRMPSGLDSACDSHPPWRPEALA